MGVIALSSLLLVTQYWFVWPAIIVCVLVAVGYFTASKDIYQCPSCKEAFKITKLQDFFALHGITKDSVDSFMNGNYSNALGAVKEKNATV